MSDISRNSKVVYSEYLGDYIKEIAGKRDIVEKSNLVKRIWNKDYRVWKDDPDEISNRLDWLNSPSLMVKKAGEIKNFAQDIVTGGITDVVVLGMGGSSLSCEVFSDVFEKKHGYPELHVLDTTNPGQISNLANDLDLERTLIIVSTKSGTTIETLSLMKYFYRKFVNEKGSGLAGKNFVSITDPGTSLENLSGKLNFRKTFLNDPDIGGRFSVLSYFGLVPAALAGIDIDLLLSRALNTAGIAAVESLSGESSNSPAAMGLALGELANRGINKMRMVTSDNLVTFSLWLEQLIAESTGKEGKSILPVYEDGFDPDYEYGRDSYFVFLRRHDDENLNSQMQDAIKSGMPVLSLEIEDKYDIGDLFFRWEFAVSFAGAVMGINPFDQPNVEESKKRAKNLVEDYKERGSLKQQDYDFSYRSIAFFDGYHLGGIDGFRKWMTEKTQQYDGRYICLQLYLEPTAGISDVVKTLVSKLRIKYKLPVVVGYGPRYLHSSGQLHKGDSGNGIFMQISSEIIRDIPIPDNTETDSSSLTFGILNTAQAIGDYLALKDKQRDAVRLTLGPDTIGGLNLLHELV